MSRYAMYGYGLVISMLVMTCAVLINMDVQDPHVINSIVYEPCIEADIDTTKELTPFEQEFLFQRNMLGPGMIFEWEGSLYTTDYK